MATSTISGSHWTLTNEQRGEWVTMGVRTTDEHWMFTDAAGHEHRYDSGYPTLDYVVDASHWCDGREGLYSHDPHEAVDDAHYECKLCREVIKPGTHPPEHQVYVAGSSSYRITGLRSDGAQTEAMLMPDQVERIASAARDQRDAIVQTLLDEMPGEQIWSMQFASRFGGSAPGGRSA